MNIDWPSVLPIWMTQTVWVTIIVVSVAIIVRRTIDSRMKVVVDSLLRKMDVADINLATAEQHTRLQRDTELDKSREMAEHRKRIRDIIRNELEKQRVQMEKDTTHVVEEVRMVPEATTEKIASMSVGLKSSDSHFGFNQPPSESAVSESSNETPTPPK